MKYKLLEWIKKLFCKHCYTKIYSGVSYGGVWEADYKCNICGKIKTIYEIRTI